MDRLCDEVLQLVFYELSDPSPLTLVSQRFLRFSQDPYVRAHYFLTHYGTTEAMFYALGRGKVMNERVLDILMTSGARLSRYLIQIAIHHYFHTQAHFIKSPWVRTVPLRVFAYFLKLAEEKYGEIPHGKGEDDGSVFTIFLKESRFPAQMKSVTWETIRDIMEKYDFIPFSTRDPIMAQFPLALAIEPRLLPCAVANGFQMDGKYRDFVFRKMFERPATTNDTRADDIVHNVKELSRLDPQMFVTRTVAAEVCMEAKTNEAGYSALKQLDKSGHLLFDLSSLVEDLIKTFLTTRSICNVLTGDILRFLYSDFPSTDPAVRLVILIVVFIAAENLQMSPPTIHSRLETLGILPVTKKDAFSILINPFVERYTALLEYARQEIILEDGKKGLDTQEIRNLVEEVAVKCLDVACKGKLLKKLHDGFPTVHDLVARVILEDHQVRLQDLPSWEDRSCKRYEARLCRDFLRYGLGDVRLDGFFAGQPLKGEDGQGEESDEEVETLLGEYSATTMLHTEPEADEGNEGNFAINLGPITQESLTTMIRHDEATPARSRRRLFYAFGVYGDSSGKLHYPHDPLPVGKWIKSQFGARSSVTAVFMTHAVINDNSHILQSYIMEGTYASAPGLHVPVTFKHFQILARLGRSPNFYMYHDIEDGAEFYFDEDDYVSKSDPARGLVNNNLTGNVKTEAGHSSIPYPASPTSTRGRKRPRRSTAVSVRSYAVPDSDDEEINDPYSAQVRKARDPKVTSLQLWIRHLGELLKTEQKKYKDKKKRLEKNAEPGTKIRLCKNDFFKSLATNLRNLRRLEQDKRLKYSGPEDPGDEYSEDDDEYLSRATRKRRPLRSS